MNGNILRNLISKIQKKLTWLDDFITNHLNLKRNGRNHWSDCTCTLSPSVTVPYFNPLSRARLTSIGRTRIIADPHPVLLTSTLCIAPGPGLPGAPVSVNWNIMIMTKRRYIALSIALIRMESKQKFLTRFSLLIDDGLDPPLERADLWPPAGLVLPVVGWVPQQSTVETTARENTHKCEAVVILFSDEGTSCLIK